MQKISSSTRKALRSYMRGDLRQRLRSFAPWLVLWLSLGLLFSALWLRHQDQQEGAPQRRVEVQVDSLKILEDAGWQQWRNSPLIARTELEKVADAWVKLTREHAKLANVAPSRLSQVDGGRLTAYYSTQASPDEVAAHVALASEQLGVAQVWSDEAGYLQWAQSDERKRWSSFALAWFSLLLALMCARWLWLRQCAESLPLRRTLLQLGIDAKSVNPRVHTAIAGRAALGFLSCALLFGSIHLVVQRVDTPAQGTSTQARIASFRARSVQIPLRSQYRCEGACAVNAEERAEHAYVVDHKLGVLARQDRALERHEKALRPWLWSLSREPSTPAQRTVLAANLVGPELGERFSAWEIEDAAFRRSLREIEQLARRKQERAPSANNKVGLGVAPSCANGQAPWAKGSLGDWVQGTRELSSDAERLAGLQENALRIVAPRGSKIRSSVEGEVAAILRDTPGRWTLILDSGQSWVWALSGMAAVEVHTGDRVQVGDDLGEVARPGPRDEGSSRLRVELWHGPRAVDPLPCFDKEGESQKRLAKKSESTLGEAQRGRYTAR